MFLSIYLSSSHIIHRLHDYVFESSYFLHLCLIEFIFNLCLFLYVDHFQLHFLNYDHYLSSSWFCWSFFTLSCFAFSCFVINMHPRAAPQQNPDHDFAFFVHPSEGPTSLTVFPKLDGSSSVAWNHSMKCALGMKNKLRFIYGSITTPNIQDLNCNAWESYNHLVQSWLINSVSDSIAQTIVLYDTTFDVWHNLHEHFSKVDRIHIATLRSSINNLK